MSHIRLKQLIDGLKAVNDQPDSRGEVNEIITILSQLKNKNMSDDQIASYAVTIITEFPYMMNHPNNTKLRELCRNLKPDKLDLPMITRQKFFGEAAPKKLDVPRSKPAHTKR